MRSTLRNRLTLWLALLACGSLAPGLVGQATAGCLREWDACGECVRKAARRAVRDADVGELLWAVVDGIDCDIDLYHCVVLGQHHRYVCAA